MNTPSPLLRYITFGGGVDSTGLLIAANLGLWNVGVVHLAVYCDCGADHPDTISHVLAMQKWSRIPLHIIKSDTSLIDDLVCPKGFISIPAYLWPRGMLRRQCTSQYKIRWVKKFIRRELGLRPLQRIKGTVEAIVGIGSHEAHRAHPMREKWISSSFPMVSAGVTRDDCLKIIADAGIVQPRRSACICCPLHSKSDWAELKGDGNNPQWKTIVEIDHAIRDRELSRLGRKCFLSCRFKPIDEVNFCGTI